MDPTTAELLATAARVFTSGQRVASETRRLCETSEELREAAEAARREVQVAHLVHTRTIRETHRLCRPSAASGEQTMRPAG